jgi:tungstate transport system ATP-binding protein
MSVDQVMLLELSQVSQCFARAQALSQVSLRVHAGERIALIGINGSGKSTLLRVMAGLLVPSSGFRTCKHVCVGMLFQRPWVMRTSVLFHVRCAMRLAGQAWWGSTQAAMGWLNTVGLDHLARVSATHLSVGQQQRLALACALAQRPQLLLLDEPTASLDVQAREQVQQHLMRMAGEGLTMVFASHQVDQVRQLATRVIGLHEGRVMGDWSAEAFFDPAQQAQLPQAARLFLSGLMT